MTGLGHIIPLEIAFKVVYLLGILLLPICIYFMFRLMRLRFPIPILGAIFSLIFLFQEGNSMWGGNVLSTFAGEFSYSLSMITDWPAALENARRHLNPEGRLVVLDFADFGAWGVLGSIIRGWLRMHHVETKRPHLLQFDEIYTDLRIYRRLGGYFFIAVGK